MPNSVPTLLYDGVCRICRAWIGYWRALTGDRVIYRPYQDAADEFPDIPREEFERAIQLIEPNGQVHAGAAATYRVLAYAPRWRAWSWLYKNLPGFAPASEWAYAFFSQRRNLLGRLTRLLWGRNLAPETYDLVGWLFLRLLGLVYIAAFASLAAQVLGLIGSQGVLPASEYFAEARQGWGAVAYWRLPSLFWLGSSDPLLYGGTILGAVLGGLVVLGLWVRPALIALFALYLSYVYAGQVFLNYQWDLLLLESGFLAIFLIGGSRIIVWLYRWLLFRYLFLSGAVKLLSADESWRGLAALKFHFWTQPLPAPLAWTAARMPDWLLVSGAAATLIVELGLAFLVFLPRRPRALAGMCVLVFQLLIVLTGNYAFFNLLTMALCLFLFDDAALERLTPARRVASVVRRAPRPSRLATLAATLLAAIAVPVGFNWLWRPFTTARLPLAGPLAEAVSPFLIVNPYGPFATMTATRPEIVIEGSDDGRTWRKYVFPYKPGPVDRAPTWNIPHQPRLDWQMWFAAYGSPVANPWFQSLARRLLEGSSTVLALFATNPFPERPPKFVRAMLYDYRFADAATRARTGQWWARRVEGLYLAPVSLSEFTDGRTM